MVKGAKNGRNAKVSAAMEELFIAVRKRSPVGIDVFPLTKTYADFTEGGFTRLTNIVKPDLVAPKKEVMTTTVGGGYAAFTGTSFATPFVTGSAALLMEWRIVRGNDPYLYGEKVKAYLRKGAQSVGGYEEYPNVEVGWGRLCLAESIPYGIS